MNSSTLAVVAFWLGGVAVICREDTLGRPMMGAALALAGAALVGTLS